MENTAKILMKNMTETMLHIYLILHQVEECLNQNDIVSARMLLTGTMKELHKYMPQQGDQNVSKQEESPIKHRPSNDDQLSKDTTTGD